MKECQPVTRGASEQTPGLDCTLRTPDMGERAESRMYSEGVKHQGVDGIHFPEEMLKTFKVSIMCVEIHSSRNLLFSLTSKNCRDFTLMINNVETSNFTPILC